MSPQTTLSKKGGIAVNYIKNKSKYDLKILFITMLTFCGLVSVLSLNMNVNEVVAEHKEETVERVLIVNDDQYLETQVLVNGEVVSSTVQLIANE